MLHGERVILRPVEPRDLDAFIALFSAAGMEHFWPGEDREKLTERRIGDAEVEAIEPWLVKEAAAHVRFADECPYAGTTVEPRQI